MPSTDDIDVVLEACRRFADDDPLSRDRLAHLLAGFRLDFAPDDAPIVKGLTNMANSHAEGLLQALLHHRDTLLAFNVKKLEQTLRDIQAARRGTPLSAA